MGTLRNGSLSEQVLVALAELRVATRRMIGAVLYYYDEKEGKTRPYIYNSPTLTRAIQRLVTRGLVVKEKEDDVNYLYLSEEGERYVALNSLCPHLPADAGSVKNARDRKGLLAHAMALYAARSMRLFAFTNEKPSFGELMTTMGSMTYFGSEYESHNTRFSEEEIEKDLLSFGICYSRREIRRAYDESTNKALLKNTSRRIGMIFKEDSIVTLFHMERKNTVLTIRSEQDFDDVILEDTSGMYASVPHVKRVAYILANSFAFIPSVFHGRDDGVEHRRTKSNMSAGNGIGRLKVDKLPGYEEIYLLPKQNTAAEYREALDFYNEDDYEKDLSDFKDLHPEEKGSIIICRYPDLARLRRSFLREDPVVLVGPSDPLMVDVLSRCMRTCITAYYDIDTGERIKYTRYDKFGYPLIGDTNKVDFGRKPGIDRDLFWFKKSESEEEC